jgi:hypothetical protein
MGIPMIVTASPIAVAMCSRASHHPATMIQMILPIVLPVPAPGLRTRVRPNEDEPQQSHWPHFLLSVSPLSSRGRACPV